MDSSNDPDQKFRESKAREIRAKALRTDLERILHKYKSMIDFWRFHSHVFRQLEHSPLSSEIERIVRDEGINADRVPNVFAQIYERIEEEAWGSESPAKVEMTPASLLWYLNKLISREQFNLAGQIISVAKQVRRESIKSQSKRISGPEQDDAGSATAFPTGTLVLFSDLYGEQKNAIRFKRRVEVSDNAFEFLRLAAEHYNPDDINKVSISRLCAKFKWKSVRRLEKAERKIFTRNKAGPLASLVKKCLQKAGVRNVSIKVRLRFDSFDVHLPEVRSIGHASPPHNPKSENGGPRDCAASH